MAGEPGPGVRTDTVPSRPAGLAHRLDEDRGATATEYALLVGFIAIVIAVAVGFFGSQLSTYFDHITTSLSSAL